MNGSGYSVLSVESDTQTPELCRSRGPSTDLIVVITNSKQLESSTVPANISRVLLRTKAGHLQVGGTPGTSSPATGTLADRAIVISTDGPISSGLLSTAAGFIDFGSLDSADKFALEVKRILLGP